MKICHFSDIKSRQSALIIRNISDVDLIIFSGNCTFGGYAHEFAHFINWFMDIRCKYKVFIAGNRDYCLQVKTPDILQLLNKFTATKGCFYLQNSSCVIEGKNIYGNPYSLYTSYGEGNDNLNENNFIQYDEALCFGNVPQDINILITNCPPSNILDKSGDNTHIGLTSLLKVIDSLPNLQLHCFGRSCNHGIYDTFDVKFSNGNVLDNSNNVTYQPNIFEID